MRARVAMALFLAAVVVAAGCGAPAGSPAVPTPSAPTPSAPPPSASATATPSPAPTGAGEVRLFFTPAGVDPCGTVAPVVRRDVAPEPTAALAALLAGPNAEEAAAGYTSLFGPATADALLGVDVVDGIAHVSFADLRPLIPNASSSCGSASLLAALDTTLAQFAGIRGARYSFGGDEAAFYEWLQMAPPD